MIHFVFTEKDPRYLFLKYDSEWDEIPTTRAELDNTSWNDGKLVLDDDDNITENYSNESDLNDNAEIISESDDIEESAPEDIIDDSDYE